MKTRLVQCLSLSLAGTLQLMPLTRALLPAATRCLAPSGWAIVFRWVAGAAILGYDAVSRASSIAISPPNAIVGQPYVGTITYSGGHAGAVHSMAYQGICLGSSPFVAGLTITYNGGNTATVSGTPTAATNYTFSLSAYSRTSCGAGDHDTRSTSLIIGTAGGSGVAPAFSSPPESVTAQEGADALLSAAASGNPAPTYYWSQGLLPIPGATSSSLHFPAVDLTNAGLYTVTASNASGKASATCFLSVCLTPGTNQLALDFTNYHQIGKPLTMYSYLTNVPAASNVFKWQFNYVDITPYATNGNTLSLSGPQVTGNRSGIYSIIFNSVVGPNTVVNQQEYYSYWAFGAPPHINTASASATVPVGGNVTFDVGATGSNVLSYQWVFDGTTVLDSQTNASLALLNVSSAEAGTYQVIVTNFWGSTTSSPITLTISGGGTSPTITSQPSPQSVLAGQTARFSVAAQGTAPLAYQWQWNGANLADNATVSGATTDTLTLLDALPSNQGAYSVVVSNAGGSTPSNPANLVVSPPPNLGLEPVDAATYRLMATTLPGVNYVVEMTTNLAAPSWIPVETNVTSGSGVAAFTNSLATPEQYFRLTFP